MNGPTEREQRWPRSGDCVRVSFNANLVSIDSTGCCGTFERGGEEFHFGACTIREASEADRESAALRARVAVLEQQIAAVRAIHERTESRIFPGRVFCVADEQSWPCETALAAGVVDPTEPLPPSLTPCPDCGSTVYPHSHAGSPS